MNEQEPQFPHESQFAAYPRLRPLKLLDHRAYAQTAQRGVIMTEHHNGFYAADIGTVSACRVDAADLLMPPFGAIRMLTRLVAPPTLHEQVYVSRIIDPAFSAFRGDGATSGMVHIFESGISSFGHATPQPFVEYLESTPLRDEFRFMADSDAVSGYTVSLGALSTEIATFTADIQPEDIIAGTLPAALTVRYRLLLEEFAKQRFA